MMQVRIMGRVTALLVHLLSNRKAMISFDHGFFLVRWGSGYCDFQLFYFIWLLGCYKDFELYLI